MYPGQSLNANTEHIRDLSGLGIQALALYYWSEQSHERVRAFQSTFLDVGFGGIGLRSTPLTTKAKSWSAAVVPFRWPRAMR
jgi:hypothetical protein